MHAADYLYHHDNLELKGFLAYDKAKDSQRPAVIIVHDWSGRNDFACQKAQQIAHMGYLGFALDMYGQGRTGNSNDEKTALMNPLATNRSLLRDRIRAAYDTVRSIPEVDTHRIAVIGFCFGGLCALDLARSGADLKGVISFHGLLGRAENLPSHPIKAKVLALHGYNDPMVKPEQVHAFCQEMTDAKVDWQVHMYGHVQHAFTNPQAHDLSLGLVYHSIAAQRAWQAMCAFLQEIF